MRERAFGRNVQHEQAFVQGRNGRGNSLSRPLKQTRGITPGNEFNRKIRPEIPGISS